MSKKDYEKAASIAQSWRNTRGGEAEAVINSFVALFSGDNPLFDEARFRKACVTWLDCQVKRG